MKGYVRRKITYNLGKGGRGSPRASPPIGAMPGLFQRYTGPMSQPERAVIVDELGVYPIDEEYRKLGVNEGWLIFTRYYFDPDETLVLQYEMRGLPD